MFPSPLKGEGRARPPQTVMGAGIAAGPHCPFASGSAEAGLSQWAVSRRGNQDRSWPRFLRSPSEAEASSGFPEGSPSGPKPWRFAARRIRNLRSSSRPWRFQVPKHPNPRPAGSSAEALVPPDMAMSRSPGSMPVRSSRAEARSCPTPPEPKLLLSRWQRAGPKTPLSAGLVLDPKIRCPA